MTTILGAALLMPLMASAHEHQVFTVGTKTYDFTIGSLNEPVTVDDKSGVDLTIVEKSATGGTTPVTGLEATLKAEVIAGSAKKVFDLSPVYGKPGGYKAIFYPTVQTTYTYRVFGTLNGTQIDLSFSCNPRGHGTSEDWKGSETVSPGVVRIEKRGTFGCPSAKEGLGFPEPAPSLTSMGRGDGSAWGIAGTVLGALGTLLGILALRKRPSIQA